MNPCYRDGYFISENFSSLRYIGVGNLDTHFCTIGSIVKDMKTHVKFLKCNFYKVTYFVCVCFCQLDVVVMTK